MQKNYVAPIAKIVLRIGHDVVTASVIGDDNVVVWPEDKVEEAQSWG